MYASIIVLFFLISCNESVLDNPFYKKINVRWFAGVSIEKEQNLKVDEFITKPKSIDIPLLKIGFLSKKGNVIYDCLYYKPSDNNSPGELKVIHNPESISCEQVVSEKEIARIDEVYNFKLNFKETDLILFVDQKEFKFSLLNLGTYSFKKFEAPIKDTFTKGVVYLSNIDSELKKNVKLKDGEYCYKVDDDCSILKKNNCDSCESTWHELIDSKCSSSFSRVCGEDQCGKKGQIACIRGSATVGLDSSLYCINDSPFGFCQGNLRVMCLNEVLVCM